MTIDFSFTKEENGLASQMSMVSVSTHKPWYPARLFGSKRHRKVSDAIQTKDREALIKATYTAIVIFLLLIAAFFALRPGVMAQPPKADPALPVAKALNNDDDAAVRKVINSFVASWNTSDMKAMDKLFCEDAEFVNVVGMHWRGRAQIDAAHTVFDKIMFHGVQMKVDSIGVRPLGSDFAIAVVLETLDSYTTPSGRVMPKGQIRGTWVLARNGGNWKIAHCQNVNVDAEAAKHDPVNNPKK